VHFNFQTHKRKQPGHPKTAGPILIVDRRRTVKRFVGEVVAGFLVIAFTAGALEMFWRLTKYVYAGEPIDKTFVAAAAICYVFYRTSRDKEF